MTVATSCLFAASGTSVVVFPEGTRSRDGRLGEFKGGAMHLAIKAGVPVVPVVGKINKMLKKYIIQKPIVFITS